MNDQHPQDEYLSLRLYEHYCEAVGGKAFNGDPLPNWQTFASDPQKQKQVEAWRSVTRLALELVPERLNNKPPRIKLDKISPAL